MRGKVMWFWQCQYLVLFCLHMNVISTRNTTINSTRGPGWTNDIAIWAQTYPLRET